MRTTLATAVFLLPAVAAAAPMTYYAVTDGPVAAHLTDQQGVLSPLPGSQMTWTGNFTIDNEAEWATINGVTLALDITVAHPDFFDGEFRIKAKLERLGLQDKFLVWEDLTSRVVTAEAWHIVGDEVAALDMSSAEPADVGNFGIVVNPLEPPDYEFADAMSFIRGWSFTFDAPAGIPIYAVGVWPTVDAIAVQGIPATFTLAGDMNADGSVDFNDLSHFADALADPFRYTHDHMMLDRLRLCDVSADSECNFNDLSPFVELLTGDPTTASSSLDAQSGYANSIPEPAGIVLLGIVCVAMTLSRWRIARK